MRTPRYRTIHGCLVASLFASLVVQVAAAQSASSDTGATSAPGAETNSTTVVPAAAEPTTVVDVQVDAVAAGTTAGEVTEAVVVENPAAGGAAIVTGEIIQTEPAPAKPRYNRDDVRWIQERLAELGYYEGTVDGAYGRVTREAIKAYQADQELEQDGRPTPELRDFMWRNGG